MAVDKTLYDVLGVDPNATQETILRAVRTKSREHHPDRGGSHEMMQQVNAAREILTDPEKRRIYDQCGLEGMRSRTENGNFPFSGFPNGFDDLINLLNPGSNRRNNSRTLNGTDIKHVLKVSLEELYLGTTKTVKIDRDVVCTNCKGTGCHDGLERRCANCDGTGIETLIHRMGPFIQQTRTHCSLCNGTGNMIDDKNRCKTCLGKKVFREEKILDVNIAPGSQNGETIKLIGEANQFPNGTSGTVYIILKQEPHLIFERNNDNLIMKIEINLTESLCGFQRVIKLLDDHQILINHPSGKAILPNSYRCLRGYGMPNRHTHSHGDLIIHFDVKFPDKNFILTENQRQQLESILPPKQQVTLNNTDHYEQGQMMEYEISRENFQNGREHHRGDDEDGDFDEQPQSVQCQTQ